MLLYVKADSNKISGMSFYLIHPSHQWYMGDEAVKVRELQVEYEHPDTMDELQLKIKEILSHE